MARHNAVIDQILSNKVSRGQKVEIVFWRINRVQSSQAKPWRMCSSKLLRQYVCNKLCGRPPQYATVPCKLTF